MKEGDQPSILYVDFNQDRCQIEGLDNMVATIYNTSLLVGKSGTSVDVKVDVKNVTE